MSKIVQALAAAAGNAGAAADNLYVEDVFSTYLYEGNGSVQAIENGIALRGLPTDGVYVHLNAENATNVAPSSIGVFFNNALRSDERPKFGTKSYKFIPASTSYLYLSEPVIDSSDSFCVETWAYFIGNTGVSNDMQMIAAQYKSGEAGRMLFGSQSENVVVRVNGGTVYLSGAVSADTWHHIAWTYDGTTHRLFVDGNLEDSTASMPNIFTGVNTQIGGTDESLLAGYNLDGFLDEFRITKGKPRYVSNFSVPTSAFTEDVDDGTGHGGMVWFKNRDGTNDHYVTDTEISPVDLRKNLNTNKTDNAVSSSGMSGGSGWGHSGFSVGPVAFTNKLGDSYASWTFRKAEKFFDVVTYTGTGTPQTVAHNLGVAPAIIITKKTSGTSNWAVNDPSQANPWSGALLLNSTDAFATASTVWNDTAPTDSVFTVGTADATNVSGQTYVAYLFASDAGGFGDDGSESIIKCGSFTASTGAEVDLGFEPQWVLLKSSTGAADWYMVDNMRGWGADRGSNDAFLSSNTLGAEFNSTNSLGLTPTGFTSFNGGNQTYIYIAIRRPMKTPESGTEVFTVDGLANGTAPDPWFISNFVTDMTFVKQPSAATGWLLGSRLTGTGFMATNSTAAESAQSNQNWDYMNGVYDATANASYLSWMFKRATGFFDVVAYSGDGISDRSIPHNLAAIPEFIIIKRRTNNGSGDADAEGWAVWHKDLTAGRMLYLNRDVGEVSYANDSYYPSYSTFTSSSTTALNTELLSFGQAWINSATETYITYLFATLDGVSKVGSFSHTQGTATNVDCGFSNGARFVLWKKYDGTDGWQVYDSVRGINAGADPFLQLNSTAAEISEDLIDPYAAGFSVASGKTSGNYIFLAIS